MVPVIQMPITMRELVVIQTIDGKLDKVTCYTCESESAAASLKESLCKDCVSSAVENNNEYIENSVNDSIEVVKDSHMYRFEYRIVKPIPVMPIN